MKWILIAVVVVVALVLALLVIGVLRPASHEASHTVVLAAPPERVWAEISDIARSPEWVPQVREVERLPDHEGRPSWRENFDGFNATTVIRESDAPRRLVKEILPTGPFFGSWTWELAAVGADSTRLIITERGTVSNPFFRGMMLFHDNTKSARDYAAALEARLAGRARSSP